MATQFPKLATLAPGLPAVCRLGLATRGNGRLAADDVEWALERGINYLNWCGKPDGMSRAIARSGGARGKLVIATQLEARTAADAGRELSGQLEELGTGSMDVVTLYYVESREEWSELLGPDGAWSYLARQKRLGRIRLIGLTTHQRQLAAEWAASGRLDLLMIRFNAAHRGAREQVFPVARERGIPVVTFTGLRWKALLAATPEDPPGFTPPPAADCYRFCLGQPEISVVLTAPATRAELESNLSLLDDWRPLESSAAEAIARHGDRVRRHAGTFW